MGLDPDIPLQKVELPKEEGVEEAEEEEFRRREKPRKARNFEKFECGLCGTVARRLCSTPKFLFRCVASPKGGTGGRRVHQRITQG